MKYIEDLSITMQLDEFEQKILQYIYTHIDDTKKVQIRAVAAAHFTSTATVFKLAKQLGFSGYSEMIYAIRHKQQTPPSNISTFDFIQDEALLHKDEFLALLEQYKSKRILILGFGFSRIIANYISERLVLNGYHSTTSDHIQLLLANYQSETLLIVISQSGKNARLVEIIQNAASRNIDIISFCGDAKSPIAQAANLSIICEFAANAPANLQIPNTFFAYTILCFETMFNVP